MSNPYWRKISIARHAAGLNQTEAGERVGVTKRTWIKWEGGESAMPVSAWELFLLKSFSRATNKIEKLRSIYG